MSERDAELLREIKKLNKSGNSSPVETTGLKSAIDNTKGVITDFSKTLLSGGEQLLGTFQDVSKSGASFSTDILGMGKAAFESRLSLAEFADVIKTNSTTLAGMGGNVTRGAEAFAKLSKTFFDDKSSSSLRDLGYTSKELNEVLALSVGMQKSGYKDTEEGRKRSVAAAQNLAYEMDAVAKLTGKSREQQAEEMKKAQADGRVEAKFRLMAQGKSEEEIAKMKEQYQLGLLQAQKNGTEQMYKEFFATGTYNTKQAATQSALMGEQSRAMEEQVKAMQSGDFTKAGEARSKVDAESMKNANDRTLLNLATFGDAAGSAGTIAQKNVETTDTMYHSVKKVAEANGILLNTQESYAKALQLALDDVKAAQTGLRKGADGKYQDVAQSGRAMVTTQQATQDAKAAAASVAEAAAKQKSNEENLGAMSDKYRRTLPFQDLEKKGKAGLEPVSETTPEGRKKSAAQLEEERGGITGKATKAVADLGSLVIETAKNIYIGGEKIPGKSTGSLGTTGKIIEDFGAGTLTMLHGKEGVITEDQMANLAKGIQGEGASTAIGALKSALPKSDETKRGDPTGGMDGFDLGGMIGKLAPPDENKPSFAESMAASVKKGMQTVGVDPNMRGNPTGGMNGLDLSSISKAVSTSISTTSGGGSTTTQRTQSDDSKTAEKELKSVKEQYAAERTALAAKFKESMPDASFGERRRAMNASDESKSLEAKYNDLMKPLEQKIESGIKWETSKKEEQVETTKALVAEEMAIVKLSNATLLEETKDYAEQQLEVKQEEVDSLADYYGDMDSTLQKFADNASAVTEKFDMGEFAGVDEAVAKEAATSKFDMGEFAGVDEAVAKEASSNASSASGINLDMFNMPGMSGSIKAQAATIPKAVNKTASPGKKINPETGEEYTPVDAKPAAAAKPAAEPQGKAATMNDVVKQLQSLNMLMGQLLSKTEDLGAKQIKATKSSGANLYKA
jgi:hypothetical protein